MKVIFLSIVFGPSSPLQAHPLNNSSKDVEKNDFKINEQVPIEEALRQINDEIENLEKEIKIKLLRVKRLHREADRLENTDFSLSRRKRTQAHRNEEVVANLERKVDKLRAKKMSYVRQDLSVDNLKVEEEKK